MTKKLFAVSKKQEQETNLTLTGTVVGNSCKVVIEGYGNRADMLAIYGAITEALLENEIEIDDILKVTALAVIKTGKE